MTQAFCTKRKTAQDLLEPSPGLKHLQRQWHKANTTLRFPLTISGREKLVDNYGGIRKTKNLI